MPTVDRETVMDERLRPLDDLAEAGLVAGLKSEMRLAGSRCENCGILMIGSRYACSTCVSTKIVAEPLAATGTVYSSTVIHVAGGDKGPKVVAYIDLDDGIRTFAQLSDCSAASIGTRVHLAADNNNGWWFVRETTEGDGADA